MFFFVLSLTKPLVEKAQTWFITHTHKKKNKDGLWKSTESSQELVKVILEGVLKGTDFCSQSMINWKHTPVYYKFILRHELKQWEAAPTLAITTN